MQCVETFLVLVLKELWETIVDCYRTSFNGVKPSMKKLMARLDIHKAQCFIYGTVKQKIENILLGMMS